ncbi:uncharacterized protein [Amphiura filiformis]|uniref:uncharacterized protein n=1 Tax=Amphiura filiformis TaxID=82378 RepID=UPI003B20FBD9
MHSSKEVKQNPRHPHLQNSRLSLIALSQHKGISVPHNLTSKVERSQPSFIAVNTNQLHRPDESGSIRNKNEAAFATPDNIGAYADGREFYAPTNSILQIKVSSVAIARDSIDSFSSVVSPSVFHIIPELQRGQSSYHIDYTDSSSGVTSGWYTSFGDIDYLWSVIPTTEALTESVKAAVLDTYTDSSLPTILQPRFKAKAPGTALALWVPNIMASLAKRFTDESTGDLPAGDKSSDIVKQNIGLLLKKDLISNWPFTGTLTRQSDDPLYDQQQRNRRKSNNHHRAKVKHLRGGEKADHKQSNKRQNESAHSGKTMAEKLTWRGPWRKSRIKYVEPKEKDLNADHTEELDKYDSTPVMPRRRQLGNSQDLDSIESERSSSAELPDVFPDELDESMVFFNYSDDGRSYTCTLSPIRSMSEGDSRLDSERSESSATFFIGNTVYSDEDDSEDEEELYEESFRLETEHVSCECIKYARNFHDEFPYLKTLEDIENKEPNISQPKTLEVTELDENIDNVDRSNSKTKGGSLKRRDSLRRMSSRQRRLTDTGRRSPRKDADDGVSVDVDPQQIKDIREKIEYMRVASQEDVKISAKLYIRIPEKVNLCKIQTHLLLCAMRAFFTCNEGIQVRWVKSLHYKIYQLMQRSDTKIKFSCPDDDNKDILKNNAKVCLVLSYDASVLLRDRQSSLLTSVADILQIKPENLLVLELEKKICPAQKKTKKGKSKKSSSSEVEESAFLDVQTEWFLPVFF